jgi:hypothetical protein
MTTGRQENSDEDPPASVGQWGITEIVAAKHCGRGNIPGGYKGHTWRQIGRALSEANGEDVTWQATRARYLHRDKERYPAGYMPVPCPVCAEEREGGVAGLVQVAISGNYATADSRDGRIRTEADLRAACQLDEDTWNCFFFEAGTYEGFAKNEDKDLTFTAGVIDGHARSKGLIIAPMFRTKGRFVRREPEVLHPAVQPVECPVTFVQPPARESRPGEVRRALLLSDAHFGYERNFKTGWLKPFHDRRALDMILQVLASEPGAWDVIAWLGDTLDMAMWTDKFVRSPAYYFTTQPSILEAHWWLRQFREACPKARILLFEGNHEMRLRTALSTHLHEACELRPADELELPPALSAERLLALHKLGIDWVGDYPDGEDWLGGLRLQHGDKARAGPGATAAALAKEGDVDTAFGHVHKPELASRVVKTKEGKRTVRTWCPGCVCHVDGRVPGASKNDHWQNGFGVVEYTEWSWSPMNVEIVDGRAIWDGGIIEGRDRVEELRTDLPGWNW